MNDLELRNQFGVTLEEASAKAGVIRRMRYAKA